MRLKSERIILSCPACKEQYRIPKKSKIIQEVDIQLAPKKKNPFIRLNEFVLENEEKTIINSYDQVVCMECGNMFALWIATRSGRLNPKIWEDKKEKKDENN